MQATLFEFGKLPPPPASPEIFAGFDCPRAREAADAWVSFIVKFIVRNMVGSYILPYIIFRPVDEGVYLNQVKLLIPLKPFH